MNTAYTFNGGTLGFLHLQRPEPLQSRREWPDQVPNKKVVSTSWITPHASHVGRSGGLRSIGNYGVCSVSSSTMPTVNIMTMPLLDFVEEDCKAILGPDTAVLRGFGLSVDRALLADLEAVVSRVPFRHMVTPGGQEMSVAMSNCGLHHHGVYRSNQGRMSHLASLE
jgi:hypothetical protein